MLTRMVRSYHRSAPLDLGLSHTNSTWTGAVACRSPRQARPKGPPSTHFTRRMLLVMPRRCPFHPLINGSGSSGIVVTFSRRTTTYSHSSSEINGMARACGSQPTAPPQRARISQATAYELRVPYGIGRTCGKQPRVRWASPVIYLWHAPRLPSIPVVQAFDLSSALRASYFGLTGDPRSSGYLRFEIYKLICGVRRAASVMRVETPRQMLTGLCRVPPDRLRCDP